MDGGEVFRLGQFQSDGNGAFLAFAGELGGWFSVQKQLHVVAVGAQESGAKDLFAGAVAGQLNGEISADRGLVNQFQSLSRPGQARAGFAGQRRDARPEVAPESHQFHSRLHQLAGEPFQGARVGRGQFEEGVAGAESGGVALEEGQIAGVGLGQQ